VRRIVTRGIGPSSQVSDVLQAVFIAELLAPSESLWLLSPWISDVPVVDNRGGEFLALLPSDGCRYLALTEALAVIGSRGTQVHVVARDVPGNQFVIQRLIASRDRGVSVAVHLRDRIHDKGLLTGRVYLEGSMNFTYSGLESNEEGLTVIDDPDLIARTRLDFEDRYLRAAGALA